MMTRTAPLAALLLLSVSLLAAADLSGSWTGTIDVKDDSSGTTITTSVKLQFSQQDGKVTGKIGRSEDAEVVPLKEVKVEGNKVSFEASNGETAKPVKFTLVVDGDHMEGDMVTSLDSEPLTGKVKVSRTKD